MVGGPPLGTLLIKALLPLVVDVFFYKVVGYKKPKSHKIELFRLHFHGFIL